MKYEMSKKNPPPGGVSLYLSLLWDNECVSLIGAMTNKVDDVMFSRPKSYLLSKIQKHTYSNIINIFKKLLIFAILIASSPSVWANAPKSWQFGFQPAASPAMEAIVNMHNFLLWIIGFIAILITTLLSYVVWRYRASRNPNPHIFYHHTGLEVCWTGFAILIVTIIMVPSLRLLHKLEMPGEADMTVKVIGKQWFWTYEYPEPNTDPAATLSFDSMMIEDHELKEGQKRLLEVDKPLVIPINTTVRFLVTGADVIHSFAIPSLGIKKDAVPGRTNETWVRIAQPGFYHGQCSELCGTRHGFMPIVIHAVTKEEYALWHQQQKK